MPTGLVSTTPFGAWLARRGRTLKSINKGRATAMRLSAKPDEVAPNSPMLDLIAKEVGVDVEQIRPFAKGQPMSEQWLAKVQTQLTNAGAHGAYYRKGRHHGSKKKKSTRAGTVLGSVEVEARALPRNGKAHGKAIVKHVKKELTAGQYNRLKKGSPALRQSARAVVGTLNIAVMRGDTHLPPLPVGDVYLILHDWLTEKGVPNVLITPRFAELFDRKL